MRLKFLKNMTAKPNRDVGTVRIKRQNKRTKENCPRTDRWLRGKRKS